MSKGITVFISICIVVAAIVTILIYKPSSTKTPQPQGKPIASALYSCDGGKTITASFYKGTTTPVVPGQPPTPSGSVVLSLSDGRTFTLAQTISADGSRYSNGNPMVQGSESFVFWSKGNGALVLENGEQKSYTGCIVVAPESATTSPMSDLPQVYSNGNMGFSIRLPADYVVDTSYQYQELGPGKTISGISFTIPASGVVGTNLAPDTYLSVEEIPQTKQCSASLFLDQKVTAQTVTDNGTTYSVASSTGAGAGNRYEETVYALPGTNPCMAVRYVVHYMVIENYPPGTVQPFDRASLLAQFDAIRRTLVVDQNPS